MNIFRTLNLTLLSSMMCLSLAAQEKSEYSRYSYGIGYGPTYFAGDAYGFNSSSSIEGQDLKTGFSGYLTYWIGYSLGLEGHGGINGYTGKYGDIYFKSTELDLGMNVKLNVSTFGFEGPFNGNLSWIPYLGLAGSSGNPIHYNKGDQAVTTRSGRHSELFVGGGLNLKYRLGPTLDFDIRHHIQRAVQDDLNDGIRSGTAKDMMYQFKLGLTYNFGSASRGAVTYARPLAEMQTTVRKTGDDVRRTMEQDLADSDGDGVADKYDKEPGTPLGARVDGSGRSLEEEFSVVKRRLKDLEVPGGQRASTEASKLAGAVGAYAGGFEDVFFDVNSALVSTFYVERLAIVAKAMKENPNMRIQVIGHADKSGDEAYNQKLGQKRADAVMRELEFNYGIPSSRMTGQSAGEKEPLGKKAQVNRRAEIRIIK